MSATGAKVSPYAAPATDKDESASAKLMEAKRAGHQVRMRISGTAGGVGGVLVVFCVIALVTGRRGGDLACRLEGDRAWLGGACVTVVEGTFHLPDGADGGGGQVAG